MKIVSWDGHTEINDGTNCEALFKYSYGLPTLEALTSERHSAAPVIAGIKFPTDHMLPPLQIQVNNMTNQDTIRRWLHQWFDGKDGRARLLIIADDDGSNQRQIYAVPLSLIQIEGGAAYQFVVSLKMGLAIVRMAEEQMGFDRQLNNTETAVSDLDERLHVLEEKLAPPEHAVTNAQASQISQAVKAVAIALGKQTKRNEFGGVYGELYRKFDVTGYKLVPAAKFEAVMAW